MPPVQPRLPCEKLIELPDGSLLAIAGAIDASTKRGLVLVSHLSADGRLDANFGGSGPLVRHSVPVAGCTPICSTYLFGKPTDAVLQRTLAGPRVVVALAAADRAPVSDWPRDIGPRRPQFTLLGLDLAGHPDTTFGRAGRQLIDFNTAARANRVTALPDGRLIVAGSASERFGIARLQPNGAIDRSLGGQGRTCLAGRTGDFPHAATGLVALPDASTVIAGWAPADQVWAGGAANETALIGKLRAQFKQSTTCFDLGFTKNHRRAKATVILSAPLRLGLRIERYTDKHTRNLGTISFGKPKSGVNTRYWNGKLHGRRLTPGCYTATLVQLDQHRHKTRTIAERNFGVRRSAVSCYDDTARLS